MSCIVFLHYILVIYFSRNEHEKQGKKKGEKQRKRTGTNNDGSVAVVISGWKLKRKDFTVTSSQENSIHTKKESDVGRSFHFSLSLSFVID